MRGPAPGLLRGSWAEGSWVSSRFRLTDGNTAQGRDTLPVDSRLSPTGLLPVLKREDGMVGRTQDVQLVLGLIPGVPCAQCVTLVSGVLSLGVLICS